MATTINYNDAAFRALFPAFANATTYPEVTLQQYWNTAILYITNVNGGWYCGGLTLAQQTQALNLMTAHLAALAAIIASGNIPSLVTAAGIDKINVTLTPPPVKNQWQWWLSLTPYGQQLFALLQVAGAGGFYVTTGAPGRAGFHFGGAR